MSAIVQDLISKYTDLLSSVEHHKDQVEREQAKAREVLYLLFNEIGKEPFVVNGKEVAILLRRGRGTEKVIQTMPTTRVRRNERKPMKVEAAPTEVEVDFDDSEDEEVILNVD